MLAILVLGVQGLCYVYIPVYRPSKAELRELDDAGGMGGCFAPPTTNWACYRKCAHPAIFRVSMRALNGDSFLSPPAKPAQWLSRGEEIWQQHRAQKQQKGRASVQRPQPPSSALNTWGNFLCQWLLPMVLSLVANYPLC